MILNVSGQQVKIGDSLQKYMRTKLESKVKKFFKNAISVNVHLGKEGIFFTAEIIINDGVKHQAILKGNSKGETAYVAFDEAMHKIGAQLRKHKELIKNHHKKTKQNDLDDF